jgi:uncharacterized protein (TIRG00374 family)
MSNKKRLWQLILGLVISAVCLAIALRNLELAELWHALKSARYWWIVPGVVVYFFAVWGRTWRWHYLLRPLKQVSLRRLFPVVTIAYMGNNIYPARAGEVIRAYVLKRREGVSISASLATIIVERMFDGLVMLIFVFVGLPFTPMPSWLRQLVIVASGVFFGALLVFFVFAVRPAWARRLYEPLVLRLVPARWQASVAGFLDRFVEGLASLRSGRGVAMIFATSLFIWLTETVKYWFVMQAFIAPGSGFPVPFYVLMLMNGVVNLWTTLPSSPGYVGTFDLPGIEILNLFGVSRDVAAAYTLVLHAALWFPITVLGAWYMWREQISWQELAKAERPGDVDSSTR